MSVEDSKGVLNLKQLKSLRIDSWANLLTGLGTAARDKLMSTVFNSTVRISDEQLEAMFDGDDMAARIVEAIPDEAMRQGFIVNIEPDAEADETAIAEVQETASNTLTALEELNAAAKLNEAWVWGRLFGGGAVYLVTEDPGESSEELDLSRVKRIISLMVLDKRDLTPRTYFKEADAENFGEVETYQVTHVQDASTSASVGQSVLIHSSRLIVFEGERTTRRRKSENGGWSHSVLQRPCDVLRDFASGFQSTSHLLTDSAQGVFKMEGLIDMIGSGGKDAVQARMEVVDMGRSVARALVLDAENEEYTREETTFTGHADILRVLMLRLSASARMPATKMMSQSPAGLNTNGEGDRAIWEDEVKAQQVRVLQPRLKRLVDVLFASSEGPTGGQAPERWVIKFNPLRQMTEAETAELRKTTSDTDKTYIDTGVLLPEEVTLSRFRASGFSTETQADLELRKEVLEMDREPEPAEEPTEEPTKTPAAETTDEPVDSEAADPGAAFNGAQVTALQGILEQVIAGTFPRETAAATIAVAFPLSLEEAEKLVGTIPDVEPEEPTPPAPPNPAEPVPPQPPGVPAPEEFEEPEEE